MSDITKLDKNFIQQQVEISENEKIYTLPCDCIDLYGGFYDFEQGHFQRMPYKTAKEISLGVEVLSSCPAGMRARFRTNSKKFGVIAQYRSVATMSHMPRTGSSGFTVLEETEKGYRHVTTLKPDITNTQGFSGQTTLKGDSMRSYVVFFPLYNEYVTEIKFLFEADCVVEKGNKYKYDLPIVYYGSSITQGGCCSRPDNCYQAYISKWHNVDYVNLGFSGGARAEDGMIDYLTTLKAKVFVIDYDHNAPNAEHLKNTHYKLYSAYRKAHPDTSIIIMTEPDYDSDPKANERLRTIKKTYLKAKANGDNNVYFLDGRKLFGKQDRENCTVDGCHPNDLGFYRMAVALNRVIKNLI